MKDDTISTRKNNEVGTQNTHKGWSIFLGILLIIGGLIVLSAKFFFAASTLYFFGWILLIGGIAQIIGSFFTGSGTGFIMVFLSGLLSTFAGGYIIMYPGASILTISVLIAAFFIIDGMVKAVTAIARQGVNWGWMLTEGILIFILGIMMWNIGPLNNLWFIGFLIGFYLIFEGFGSIINAFRTPETSHGRAYR